MATNTKPGKPSAAPAKPAVRKKPAGAPAQPAVVPAAVPKSSAKPVAVKKAVKQAEPSTAKAKSGSKRAVIPKEKTRKAKLVRDSFTMPEDEYQGLGEIKKACLKAGLAIKKSELLRIGVSLIRRMEPATIGEILASLPPLKAGRPKKEKQ